MTASIPAREPDRLIAGDTWQWTKSVADYPATDGWTLTYTFAGPVTLSFDATASSADYSVSVASTKTTIADGLYHWVARVSLAGEVHTVDEGTIYVAPNLATAKAGAFSSFAERTLPKVEAVLEGRATSDMLEYQIAGRMLKKWTPEQLWKLRARLRTEVARLRTKGKSSQRRIRFNAK